jgi:hypothetical protein
MRKGTQRTFRFCIALIRLSFSQRLARLENIGSGLLSPRMASLFESQSALMSVLHRTAAEIPTALKILNSFPCLLRPLASPDGGSVSLLGEGTTPPKLTQFSDQGALSAALRLPGDRPGDLLITINEKGKPSDPQVIHCEKLFPVSLASKSLLKSHYQPGSFNGNAVPVRVVIHREFAVAAPTN